MIGLALAIAFVQQIDPDPWAEFKPIPERLAPGPHTLVIADGTAMTRMDYKSGPACQRARDAVRRQAAPPPNTKGIIYGPPRTTAFCVPR